MPGNNTRALNKIHAQLEADYFIIDLEDAVPIAEKSATRKNVQDFMTNNPTSKKVYLRINSIDSNLYEDDLKNINMKLFKGVILSKCENATQVKIIEDLLKTQSVTPCIIPLIETVNGYYNLQEILKEGSVERIAFGAIDMANEFDIAGDNLIDNPLLNEMRITMALLSKRFNKQAPLDAPCIFIDRLSVLQQESEFAKKIGYYGKLAIHPKQLETIANVFSYSEEEIKLANEIVEIYEHNNYKTISYKNIMIDTPVYLRMKKILEESE
ncbi:HpcH/HpaI aldolase/citrate lyase family protein [Metasolibacillus fluoroglycofenilyticus]|uniref:HpcH/HpaI aldolase/citrate lyase family protein n=1 Tax=Metasolibacillus fluoroglycofenilyticus TaxID=1239396 RepID=UPI0022863303|nr:CoA ester lyase [Metasolibacillus fluoroglycofenilyticus]